MPGIRFTDGTTTVTLSDGSTAWFMEYQAQVKDMGQDTLSERAEVLALGSASTIRSTVDSLNRLFWAARLWQAEHAGAPVYVERQWETSGTWWRSEIVDGYCALGPNAFDTEIGNQKVTVIATYTRMNYWEGAETQVSLTNGNGTDNTSGLTVYNHDDSGTGHDNYVEITAAKVTGDLPAACRLEITNSTAGRALTNLYLGHSWQDTTFTPVLEGESASGGTNTASASYSGGYYTTKAWSGSGETDLLTWSISAAQMAAAKGRYLLPLLVCKSLPSGSVYFRWKLFSDGLTVWRGKQFIDSSAPSWGDVVPGPALRLSPWPITHDSLYAHSLVLTGQISGGSTFDLDYLMLMPLDGYRYFELSYDFITSTRRLVDDGLKGETYADNGSGSSKLANLITRGERIKLMPNKLQRLYFLRQTATITPMNIADTATVKLWYRPRRLTLSGG
jgi:hypothetical protein